VPIREPDQEEVRAHLARILENSGFVKADRLCRFLRFTVEAKLNGEGDQIKEYVLGREVFDRNGDYDPRTDSIVRVEARRLRTRLEEYYSGTGQTETVRIEFPKGSYIPVIHPAEAGAAEAGQPRVSQRRRLGSVDIGDCGFHRPSRYRGGGGVSSAAAFDV
jgi:serine/threonine-protein kinase